MGLSPLNLYNFLLDILVDLPKENDNLLDPYLHDKNDPHLLVN